MHAKLTEGLHRRFVVALASHATPLSKGGQRRRTGASMALGLRAGLVQPVANPMLQVWDAPSMAGRLSRASAAWGFDPTGTLVPFGINQPRLVLAPDGLVGVLREPGVTNKCTNFNANPSDLTGMTKTGDAAATLAVVTGEGALLTAAGLGVVCSAGAVYKLDNSAGTAVASAVIAGATGNVSLHSVQAWVRGSGNFGVSLSGVTTAATALTGSYAQYTAQNLTPGATTDSMAVNAAPGAVVFFVLNQLEQRLVVSSPIVVAGAAVARAREDLLLPLALSEGYPASFYVDFCLPNIPASGKALVLGTATGNFLVGINAGNATTTTNTPAANTFTHGTALAAGARGKLIHASALPGGSSSRLLVMNGGTGVTNNASWVEAMTQLVLGNISAVTDGSEAMPIVFHEFRLYRRRLEPAHAVALTR